MSYPTFSDNDMNYLFRYLATVLALCAIGLVVRRLLTRRQQKTVHEIVSLMAKVLLWVAFLSLLWAFFAPKS